MTMSIQLSKSSESLKAILRGKFIAFSAHIRKTEQTQVSNLIKNVKLFNKQQISPKPKLRRKLIKMRAEINDIETLKTVNLKKNKNKL